MLAATEVAKEKKLGVGVGLQRRHHAAYIETIKHLQDGAIGDILAARVYWNGATLWVKPADQERQVPKWNTRCATGTTSPGCAATTSVEQHIHNLDVINWLKSGHPVKANGMGGREVRKGQDYGEIFDHHCRRVRIRRRLADVQPMPPHPRLLERVTEYATGTKGTADISGRSYHASGDWDVALPRREARSRTRSSTTICSPASAPACRSTRPSTAP